MSATFDAVCDARYVLLTTFRRDGTPVATPLWAARDGERLLMWTVTDSWKVKRIRRTPEVTIAACDARGRPRGAAVPARAVVLDAAGSDHARAVVAKRYGPLGWLAIRGSVLRRGRAGTVGLAITAA